MDDFLWRTSDWQEDAPGPRLTLDEDGLVVGHSGPGEASEVMGRPLTDVFESGAAERLERCRAEGWLGLCEQSFPMRNGRTVRLCVEPTRPSGVTLHFVDVTAGELLRRAKVQERQLRGLTDLAGSVSRELIDPMSIVQGRLELLLDLGVSDAVAARRHLEVALTHARRVGATLRNLRLVGQAPSAELTAVTVRDVVDDALDLLGSRRSQIIVEINPPQLDAGSTRANAARVICGLLRATLEGSGRGSVLLHARRHRNEVVLRIGPRGRRRGPAVDVDPDLTPERLLIEASGGLLQAFRAGAELHAECVLPLAPTSRQRPRPAEDVLLLVGNDRFRGSMERLLSKDGFCFRAARHETGIFGGLADVHAVAVQLVLANGPSGMAVGKRIASENPSLAGRILVVGAVDCPGRGGVVPVRWPLRRAEVLEALGRRVRRT